MNQDLLEISDGKLYGLNDMPRVGCHDCKGCSSCCQEMGDSILLDPYDLHQLMQHLGKSFQELLEGPLELHLEEGLILPNLRMTSWKAGVEACSFLSQEGRCQIHAFRPGLCRLFPLGRNYEGDQMQYFVLRHECPMQNRSKVKVSKWLDVPQIRDYQQFLIQWHNLTKRMRAEVTENPEDVDGNKRTSMMFLQYFYAKPYLSGDFFREFTERARRMG